MNVELEQYILRSDEIVQNIELDRSTADELNVEHDAMIRLLSNVLEHLMENKKYINMQRINTADTIDDKFIKSLHPHVTTSDHIERAVDGVLYWVTDISQFLIKIGATYLRGNIGNIYTKHMINDNVVNLVKCRAGNQCKNVWAMRRCKFFHDPLELKQLLSSKAITHAFYTEQVSAPKNFINTSWLYDPYGTKNKKYNHIRSIGTRSTALGDINAIKSMGAISTVFDIEDFKYQVMHDILLLLLLERS